jgi:hypothetical protein
MFDVKRKRFKKGEPVAAADRNWMLQEAKNVLIGGAGISVTRRGRHVVIGVTPSQTIRRSGIYGNVWKLSADQGVVRWGFDTGGEAYSVCAAPNGTVYVAGERNNAWSDGGAYANVWRLSSSGKLVWGVDLGTSDDAHEVHATNDAVFVGYFDAAPKIAKLNPTNGATIATVDVLYGNAELRHGFGINATQLWTWSTVTAAQGLRAYDHDLNSIYSVTPPQTGLVDIAWGIGVSDDLVALGAAYDSGITNETLTVINTTTSPGPVTQFSIAETVSSAPPPANYEIHGNADCEENYVASHYYTEAGSRSSLSTQQTFARLYDTSGTIIHDVWLANGATGSLSNTTQDVAIDESASLFFFASNIKVSYLEGALLTPSTPNISRTLIAFDIDTGAVVWKWSSNAAENGSGADALTSVFADRQGSVYTTAYTAREPFMKRAD